MHYHEVIIIWNLCWCRKPYIHYLMKEKPYISTVLDKWNFSATYFVVYIATGRVLFVKYNNRSIYIILTKWYCNTIYFYIGDMPLLHVIFIRFLTFGYKYLIVLFISVMIYTVDILSFLAEGLMWIRTKLKSKCKGQTLLMLQYANIFPWLNKRTTPKNHKKNLFIILH